jgi:hypothetical protein
MLNTTGLEEMSVATRNLDNGEGEGEGVEWEGKGESKQGVYRTDIRFITGCVSELGSCHTILNC